MFPNCYGNVFLIHWPSIPRCVVPSGKPITSDVPRKRAVAAHPQAETNKTRSKQHRLYDCAQIKSPPGFVVNSLGIVTSTTTISLRLVVGLHISFYFCYCIHYLRYSDDEDLPHQCSYYTRREHQDLEQVIPFTYTFISAGPARNGVHEANLRRRRRKQPRRILFILPGPWYVYVYLESQEKHTQSTRGTQWIVLPFRHLPRGLIVRWVVYPLAVEGCEWKQLLFEYL